VSNVYYNPEDFGLKVIAELNDPHASWDFQDTVFWTDGKLVYGASDSGCSCPSPFESYNSLEELEVIPDLAAARKLTEFCAYRPEDVSEALRAVEAALKGQVN
jgi:hypothetical protein